MMSIEEVKLRYVGQEVSMTFNVGYVILSYVISMVGAGCTLELINRRTSLKGWHNHLMLVGAAVSMGGIAIWCMHFVGNRAIDLLEGEPAFQIAYNVGVTAASFFVPIAVLIVAFFVVSLDNEVKWWRIAISGSLSGGAICGMHYLGDASINNYQCRYVTANVVGAAVIAVSASTVALALFFAFRAAWKNSWWKRLGCTVVLAGAVSGMHWCAALGTKYILIHEALNASDSRQTTVIAVICLAIVAAAIMIVTAILSAKTRKSYAAKSQQVVLAAAVFDKEGRIMVTPDGLIPSEKITQTFPQKSHDDMFSTAHPLFIWMFRASRNWSNISTLFSWMTAHLDSLVPSANRRNGNRSGVSLVQEDGSLVENYSVIFRELFCSAASTLAARMNDDVTKVGTLWDEIFTTGAEYRPARKASRLTMPSFGFGSAGSQRSQHTADPSHDQEDLVEKGMNRMSNDAYGRGALMFLVRHLDNPADIARLEAVGYRFAERSRVVDIIKSSMQIKTRYLGDKLREMAAHGEQSARFEPGVYLGMFGVKARLDKFGFDVMVDRKTRNTLPNIKLPITQLESWHKDFLQRLEGLNVPNLLARLELMSDCSLQEFQFAAQLRAALSTLRADLDDVVLENASLSARICQVPCRPLGDSKSMTASMITLHLVLDINSIVRSRGVKFVPLQFFKTLQMVDRNGPHQAAFSRALHREMATLLGDLPTKSTLSSSSHDSVSVQNLVPSNEDGRSSSSSDEIPSAKDRRQQKPSLFGGIMVSQEIAVQVTEAREESGSSRSGLPSPRGEKKKPNPNLIVKEKGPLSPGSVKGPVSIEMGRVQTTPLATPSTGSFAYGVGSNVEVVDRDEDATTFLDDLFQATIERRRT